MGVEASLRQLKDIPWQLKFFQAFPVPNGNMLSYHLPLSLKHGIF